MRIVLSSLGVLAALILIVVSGSMNFLFMQSLGKTPAEGMVLGAASAAADLLKCLLPFFIAWAWQARKVVFVVCGSLVFAFITAFSLLSALGFAADNRGHLAGTREGLNATFDTVARDIREAETKRAGLPKHRPASVVEQAINAIKQDRRWSTSKECTEATAEGSRQFCADYFAAKAELATSIEDQRLSNAIEKLKAESERLKGQGAGQDKDPQVSIISRLFKLDESFVRNALVIFAALLVEVGSGLGLFLATGHSEAKRPRAIGNGASQAQQLDEMSPASPARVMPSVLPPASRVAFVEADTDESVREARPVGGIEDYWLACIEPDPAGGLQLPDLFAHYERWCAVHDFAVARQGEFAQDFERVAKEIGIRKNGALYVGLKLGSEQLALTG